MQYLEIVASGTYQLKTGAGYLQGVTVNLPASGTLQIFDNVTSAAPSIAGGTTAFALPAAGTFLDYDCHFSTGLRVVVGSLGAGGTITVEWY